MLLAMEAIVSILNFGMIRSLFKDDRSLIGLRDPFFFGLVNITEKYIGGNGGNISLIVLFSRNFGIN